MNPKQTRKTPENVAAGQQGLQFLRDWQGAVGLTNDAAAAALGRTRQSYWMALYKMGDLKLSAIHKVVEAGGGRINMFMTQDPSDAGRRIVLDNSRYIRRPELGVMEDRLAFMRLWMRRYHISATDIAERTGISVFTVRYYLSTSDLFFQRLVQIARAFGATLCISIEPLEEEEIQEKDLPGADGCLMTEFTVRKTINWPDVAAGDGEPEDSVSPSGAERED